MLREKFRYADYEKFQEQREYVRAQEYCASFSDDKNAVICGLYSLYCLLISKADSDTLFLELDASIKKIYLSIVLRGQQGYDKNALYFLGLVLYERGYTTEGKKVLMLVASLKKKNKKLSKIEKSARSYLELLHFQKWENNHQMADLKQAADCFGHSETCYLYADILREEGENRDIADLYEFIYAIDYCAVCMDKDTYNRKHIENHLDQISNDIRKDIGVIASDLVMVKESLSGIEDHLEIMFQKINNLPKRICDTLHQEFNVFRIQMNELSEQMEHREQIVCSLIEKAQTLNLELQSNLDTMLEIKTLAEQISVADQDIENRFLQSIDNLKNIVLEKDNLLLQEIINEAVAEIKSRFQDRLSKDAEKSIVTALFTLNFYKKMNKKQEHLIEYSGVVILATNALEIELFNRLYAPFRKYVQEEYGQKLNKYFTLGNFEDVMGIWTGNQGTQKQEKQYHRFSEFIQKNSNLFSTSSGSLFQYGINTTIHDQLQPFAKRLKILSVTRNNAAHTGLVTLEEAEKTCQSVFLSSKKFASEVTEESISLLELLLKSCSL